MTKGVVKAIFIVFLVSISLTFVVFFNNGIYSFDIFFSTYNYIVREFLGLIIIISQVVFFKVFNCKKISVVLLSTFILWLLFIFIKSFFVPVPYNLSDIENDVLYIHRLNTAYNFNILNISFIKNFLVNIRDWDLKEFLPLSSFILLFFHSALQYFINKIVPGNSLVKTLGLILFMFFGLYIWNYQMNVILLICSFMLFKYKRKTSNETY